MATLAALVSRWRSRLDDTAEPYLFSNQELTDYGNTAINEVCREIPAIEDGTTAATCQIAVVVGSEILSLSDRVVWIRRAKLSSQTKPLTLVPQEFMDSAYNDWEDADNGSPQYLIIDGVGTNKVRLYPPSDAVDTLNLTVTRLPLADMVYATDSASSPEVPAKYHDMLENGVMAIAYLKQDADTYDAKKADFHYNLWKRDLEKWKRSTDKAKHGEYAVAPLKAFS